VRLRRWPGIGSQILTHSIDLAACRQHAKPVRIGCHAFGGTACTMLGGTVVPDHSVVGAQALLNRACEEALPPVGRPAKTVSELDLAMKYFTPADGYVI
jgi:acetyltransferase-like isoleucine patch superfamily enzyme